MLELENFTFIQIDLNLIQAMEFYVIIYVMMY